MPFKWDVEEEFAVRDFNVGRPLGCLGVAVEWEDRDDVEAEAEVWSFKDERPWGSPRCVEGTTVCVDVVESDDEEEEEEGAGEWERGEGGNGGG